MEQEKKSNRLTAVLCFVMIFTGLGFVSSPRSLYVVPVTEALGIERSLYSLVDSLRYVATALVNLFFGVLVVRFGARRLIGVGFLSLALSMLCFALADGVWLLYLAGVLMGAGFTFTSTTMVGYVVGRAYPKNRGTVMGAVLAANGLGGALSTPIVSGMIHSAVGYRGSALAVGAIVLLVGIVTVSLFREAGAPPDEGEASAAPTARVTADGGKTGAVRFLLLGAVIFVTGFSLQGLQGVAAAHMSDVGLAEGLIATVLSVHMLCLTFSKFMTGFLYDRLGLRLTVLLNMIGAVCVSLLMAFLVSGTVGGVMGFCYALLSAMALPLETVMLPIYAREFFGASGYASRLGIIVSLNTAGYALGAPFLNLVFDLTGTYLVGFFVTAALMSGALVLVQLIIPKRQTSR